MDNCKICRTDKKLTICEFGAVKKKRAVICTDCVKGFREVAVSERRKSDFKKPTSQYAVSENLQTSKLP
jgi:hypothetical protein